MGDRLRTSPHLMMWKAHEECAWTELSVVLASPDDTKAAHFDLFVWEHNKIRCKYTLVFYKSTRNQRRCDMCRSHSQLNSAVT